MLAASALGRQPISAATFRMRSRVSGAIRPLPLKARLTSACETLAALATSRDVAVFGDEVRAAKVKPHR
jgi:hypothetical protein